ncbi:MAG TPA: hypothetical protein VMW08_05480 [Acidimicrobiales bacterium]|nr:hypothetical protein [Acidimicrobiales bacterium]
MTAPTLTPVAAEAFRLAKRADRTHALTGETFVSTFTVERPTFAYATDGSFYRCAKES